MATQFEFARNIPQGKSLETAVDCFASDQDFEDLILHFKMVLVSPNSSASYERSFSALRRIVRSLNNGPNENFSPDTVFHRLKEVFLEGTDSDMSSSRSAIEERTLLFQSANSLPRYHHEPIEE